VSAPPEVVALAQAWEQWSSEPSFPFRPDHCVNGTRVATRVLARFGVRARPVSVTVGVYNDFAWQLAQAGVAVEDWPEHAWAVGVDDGPAKPGRFAGHLVAEGKGWTLDISAGQFHRPGLIDSPGPILLPVELPPHGERLVAMRPRGVLVIGRAASDAWRSAPGWLRLHPGEVAEALDRTRAILAQGGANGIPTGV